MAFKARDAGRARHPRARSRRSRRPLGEKVRALSGGQARRVEIARSLMHRPDLLLLDEATVGLDIGSRESVVKIVRELVAKQGLGVLWATHLMDEVKPGDHVVVLHKGRVMFAGSSPDFLKTTGKDTVSAAFRAITGSDAARRGGRVNDNRHHSSRIRSAYGAAATAEAGRRAASASAATSACFKGIVWREVLRYLHQRERFFSALVRPLIWLFIFAAGFRQTLGVSIIPPYESYVLYEEFIAPGLIGMILLFNAMQSSLSMVYDRETGAMRTLLVSPFPRSFLLLSKLLGGVSVALLQVYAFLFVAWFWEIRPPSDSGNQTVHDVRPAAVAGDRYRQPSKSRSSTTLFSLAGVSAALCGLHHRHSGAAAGRPDARLAGVVHVVGHQAA